MGVGRVLLGCLPPPQEGLEKVLGGGTMFLLYWPRNPLYPGIAVPAENQIRGLNSNKVPAGNWIRGKTPICYSRLLWKIDSGLRGSGRKLNSG